MKYYVRRPETEANQQSWTNYTTVFFGQ